MDKQTFWLIEGKQDSSKWNIGG